MNPTRFNGFDLIHRALRGMLYDTAIQLQKTDLNSAEEVDIAFGKLTAVLWVYERHAHHENTFVLPALEKFEKEICKRFFDDHDEDHKLTDAIKDMMMQFRNAKDTIDKASIFIDLKFLVSDFVAFNLNHMNAEERILVPLMWKHYSDQELQGINAELRKSIPPDEATLTMKWMFMSISIPEVKNLLSMMKATMPEGAYQGMSMMAKEVIGERAVELELTSGN